MSRTTTSRWSLLVLATAAGLALTGCSQSSREMATPVANVPSLPPNPADVKVSVAASTATVTWSMPATSTSIIGYDVYLDTASPVSVPASSVAYAFPSVEAGDHYAQVVAKSNDARSLPTSTSFAIAAPAPQPTATVVPAAVQPRTAVPAPSASSVEPSPAQPTISLVDACTQVTQTMANDLNMLTDVLDGDIDAASVAGIMASEATSNAEIADAYGEPLRSKILSYNQAVKGVREDLLTGEFYTSMDTGEMEKTGGDFTDYCSSQLN